MVMSLFSVVQNRIPPPQPEMEPMAQPEMAAPSSAMPPQGMLPPDPAAAPMPGMVDGGYLGFAGDDKNPDMDEDRRDERMANITRRYLNQDQSMPGFEHGGIATFKDRRGTWTTPTPSHTSPTSLPSGDLGGIIARMYNADSTSGATTLSFEEYSALPSILLEAQYEAAKGDKSGTGAGPDHFYEQMAEDARIRAEERRDAMQMSNVSQKGEAELAKQQYIKDLMDAENDRKTLANNAVGQAQDTYAKLLSQADPNQGPIFRQPNQGVEYMNSIKGPTWAAPVLPETVFPENW